MLELSGELFVGVLFVFPPVGMGRVPEHDGVYITVWGTRTVDEYGRVIVNSVVIVIGRQGSRLIASSSSETSEFFC